MRKLFVLIILVSYHLGCLNYAEPEEYYLPENFEGIVVVLFGIPDGQEPIYHENKRQYIVPESGILYTQHSSVKGILNREFYLGNSQTPISHFYGQEKLDSNKAYVFDMFDGMFYLNIDTTALDYSIDPSTHDYIKINYYTVGYGSRDRSELRAIGESIKNHVINAYPDKVTDVSQFYSQFDR